MEEEKDILERVSNLPELPIHHILISFPYMDLVRYSMLYKPLRLHLHSSPSMVLEENRFWKPHTDPMKRKLDFLKCANYCIENRHQNATLNKFILRVCYGGGRGGEAQMLKLVRFAFENCVGEISIYRNLSEYFRIPLFLPTLNSPCYFYTTTLKLAGFIISSLDRLLSAFPLLENLNIVSCSQPNSSGFWSDTTCFRNLKSLELNDVSDNVFSSLQMLLFKLVSLRDLTLRSCDDLRKLQITHDELRNLKLFDCKNLVEVYIDTRGLTSFKYRGEVFVAAFFNYPDSLHAELSFIRRCRLCDVWYKDLIASLQSFNCCRLSLDFFEGLIIPCKLREKMLSPLYCLRRLVVVLKAQAFSINAATMEGLLWLCPKPEEIYFVTDAGNKIIQFHYADNNMTKGIKSRRGKDRQSEGWKHYSKKITLENFTEAQVKMLHSFFVKHSIMFEVINNGVVSA